MQGYGVNFTLTEKVNVNGPETADVFKWLKATCPEGDNADIRWNFGKFLVGRDGMPVKRYDPKVAPNDMASDIEALLGDDMSGSEEKK